MPVDEVREHPRERKPRFKTSIDMMEGDVKLVAWGSEFLGCGKAEFIRTAIRAYSAQLQQIAKKTGD